MKKPATALILVALFFALTAQGNVPSGEKLLLVGGGNPPAAALSRFCDWAGGKAARILVVTWATSSPEESFKGFGEDLAFCQAAAIEQAPAGPLTPQSRQDLLNRLKTYSAVFFTGGDQNRILDILADRELAEAMRDLYHQGVAFGGTSAGTAIMSPLSITGNGDLTVVDGDAVETRPGLGLLGGAILDTHFLRRQRENRLFGLVLKHPALLGVGIDEDTAIAVTGGRYAEVSGRAQVMLVDASAGHDSLKLKLYHAGDRVDLRGGR